MGYLATIDAPATQINTIFETLKNANSIKNVLNLKSMVIVMQRRSKLVGDIKNSFEI